MKWKSNSPFDLANSEIPTQRRLKKAVEIQTSATAITETVTLMPHLAGVLGRVVRAASHLFSPIFWPLTMKHHPDMRPVRREQIELRQRRIRDTRNLIIIMTQQRICLNCWNDTRDHWLIAWLALLESRNFDKLQYLFIKILNKDHWKQNCDLHKSNIVGRNEDPHLQLKWLHVKAQGS